MYELVAGRPLLAVGNSLAEYQGHISALHTIDLAGIPPQLQGPLRAMLAPQPASRVNALALAGASYFQALHYSRTTVRRS